MKISLTDSISLEDNSFEVVQHDSPAEIEGMTISHEKLSYSNTTAASDNVQDIEEAGVSILEEGLEDEKDETSLADELADLPDLVDDTDGALISSPLEPIEVETNTPAEQSKRADSPLSMQLSLQPEDLSGSILSHPPALERPTPKTNVGRIIFYSVLGTAFVLAGSASTIAYAADMFAPAAVPEPAKPEPAIEEDFFSSTVSVIMFCFLTVVSSAAVLKGKPVKSEATWEPLNATTLADFLNECQDALERTGRKSTKGPRHSYAAYHDLSCADLRFILARFGQTPPPQTLKNKMVRSVVERYTEVLQCMKKEEICALVTDDEDRQMKKEKLIEHLVEMGF